MQINLRGVGVARNLPGKEPDSAEIVFDCDCTKYCAEGFDESCQCWKCGDLVETTCFCNYEPDEGKCKETFESYKTNQLCLQKGKIETNVGQIQKNFFWYDCDVDLCPGC